METVFYFYLNHIFIINCVAAIGVLCFPPGLMLTYNIINEGGYPWVDPKKPENIPLINLMKIVGIPLFLYSVCSLIFFGIELSPVFLVGLVFEGIVMLIYYIINKF